MGLPIKDVLQMLVGLKEANDIHILDSDACLRGVCEVTDFGTIRQMASIDSRVFDSFDYTQSPEFIASIQGKSAAAQDYIRKHFSPEKRKAAENRLGDALTGIEDSNAAFELLPIKHHGLLDELKRLARSYSNSE